VPKKKQKQQQQPTNDVKGKLSCKRTVATSASGIVSGKVSGLQSTVANKGILLARGSRAKFNPADTVVDTSGFAIDIPGLEPVRPVCVDAGSVPVRRLDTGRTSVRRPDTSEASVKNSVDVAGSELVEALQNEMRDEPVELLDEEADDESVDVFDEEADDEPVDVFDEKADDEIVEVFDEVAG
jgi:hypothetical protein